MQSSFLVFNCSPSLREKEWIPSFIPRFEKASAFLSRFLGFVLARESWDNHDDHGDDDDDDGAGIGMQMRMSTMMMMVWLPPSQNTNSEKRVAQEMQMKAKSSHAKAAHLHLQLHSPRDPERPPLETKMKTWSLGRLQLLQQVERRSTFMTQLCGKDGA